MSKNPCVLLRERCGINQKDFAEKYDFHKTTMVYWDAGMYPEISERMNLSLAKECRLKGVDAAGELLVAYGVEKLSEAYSLWQKGTRLENASMFTRTKVGEGTDTLSPFYQYVLSSAGSLQSFCKHLLVPAASAMRYAKGHTVTMPEVIEEAFEDIGFNYLSTLIKNQSKWLETHL